MPADSGPAAVEAEAIRKTWGDAVAVDGISFRAESGEFLVLLGPSGCGKSTTLRMVAGLEESDSGRILIEGRDVTGRPPAERQISMVFQSYALFPHLNVAENIVFGLKVRRVPRAERDERLRRVAELTGLSALLERKPSQLSGGQRQRVALARAVVAEHPICLMDEPLSNLDAKLRHEMRQEIRALQQRLAMTVLYVTHDQTEAMSMADRVMLLNGGQVEQFATPDRLYDRPDSLFAAAFIGSPPMNLLPLESAGESVRLPDGRSVAASLSAKAVLGLRPEALRPVEPGQGLLLSEVTAVEYLGADSVVSARAGEAPLAVRLPGRVSLKPGDAMELTWDREDLHCFDAASERRRDEWRDLLAGALHGVSAGGGASGRSGEPVA
ncbi:ABC transporter ATP-binding protein [Aquibaculum arenosum]|uniref:ABC transporter ATP-binding protein n=1 Tax=Aquibaculum arenosum TaxID=3032591 RepID=A0ABT5YK37_9PROT|nr:ABC transporter ATP-binding protein [Fodinicurvata sp. CAU 1616]MDF2094629.1 ABC transporter ATP-binding protein [Fodinicurvata sp. CAU 1616]